MQKIQDWEKELEQKKDIMTEKEYKKLYSKKSALQSRVKRKQEQMWQRYSVKSFNKKF